MGGRASGRGPKAAEEKEHGGKRWIGKSGKI
jgi:hypothetical protein